MKPHLAVRMMMGSCSFVYVSLSRLTKLRPFMSGRDESTSTRSGGREAPGKLLPVSPPRPGKQARPSLPVRALR
jgi:hypothetical protein